jgi:hypothetical protein
MIRFNVVNGSLRPVLPSDATADVVKAADAIAQRLNAIQGSGENYKSLMQSLDQVLQKNNSNARNSIDDVTIKEIEDFYTKATGLKPWDSTKQGINLGKFDPKFYSKQVPDAIAKWKQASSAVSFAGKKIPDIDITKKYSDLDSFLHADYTFVGAPSGKLGKPIPLEQYQETLRAPTNRERQVLRETLLGTSTDKPQSLAELATQSVIDEQGEQVFGALSTDVLKQTMDEYAKAIKEQQMSDLFQGMGVPNVNNMKQDIKNAILGDMGAGGFLGFGSTSDLNKGLSKSLDKSLGIGSSVQYNWQKWFDETLAKRYEEMSEIATPGEAKETYQLDKAFAQSFVQDYLKPRFDNSKSISEFISYMDVKEDEQNVLQTQLASSALKDFSKKQAQVYINQLGGQLVQKDFDPNFYWNPELLSGTDVTNKEPLYAQQKQAVQSAWDSRNSDAAVSDSLKANKSWSQLAYEYGVDLENKDDFARLHYSVIGKDKKYDPVADTYTRQDLANFIQGDLANALQDKKTEFGNPVFLDFVTAEQKAKEFVDALNVADLPPDLKKQLNDLGIDENTDPTEDVKEGLMGILRTNQAIDIRERIKKLNEQRIKPTQEKLGFGYIQRDEDEEVKAPTGGSALFNTFRKAGYSGSESEFYTEFFPDATEEDKNLSASDVGKASTAKGAQELLGFSMPDFSDPFAAIGSFDKMLADDSTKKKETYTPKRSNFFDYFPDEEDEGAPSYFNMGSSGGFGSLFG